MTDPHWTPPVGLDQRTDDAAEEEPSRCAECNAACSRAIQRPTPTIVRGVLRRADYASNERTCERPYPRACPEVCPAAICDPHLGDALMITVRQLQALAKRPHWTTSVVA